MRSRQRKADLHEQTAALSLLRSTTETPILVIAQTKLGGGASNKLCEVRGAVMCCQAMILGCELADSTLAGDTLISLPGAIPACWISWNALSRHARDNLTLSPRR